MFKSKEEEIEALTNLQNAIRNFNENYGVRADIEVFKRATDKKSANIIFIETFYNLVKQVIQNDASVRNIRISSMRTAFERGVVGPYRNYSIGKASENEVEQVKGALPDTDGGLNAKEWWNWLGKKLDETYWEKVDTVVSDYTKGAPRIRDMVAETKDIMRAQGELSSDDAKKIASYAAALRRANEKRRGIWRFLQYFRAKAELREAANIENMLNTRLNDPDAYKKVLKQITDPTDRIKRLKDEVKSNQEFKLNLIVPAKKEEKTKEEKKSPEVKEEKDQIVIDDQQNSQEIVEQAQPGNERLYALLKNKSFEEKIRDEIWNALKLKESISLDKKTTVNNIFDPLLQSAKRINENYYNHVSSGAKPEQLEANAEEDAISLFNETYLGLESLHLDPETRVVAAQKITNTVLNSLTVIGFEKDTLGKYGDNYAVKNDEVVLELLQFGTNALSEEASEYVLRSAKKKLASVEKEKVDFSASSSSKKDVPVSLKHEEQTVRNTVLNK